MEKFTEGEWAVVRGEYAFCVKSDGNIITNGGTCVSCGECGSSEEDSIDNEADAHLIAQSKNLYFALKAAMKVIESNVADPDITLEMAENYSSLMSLNPNLILAKARGEQGE